jgi:hypothetical protein
MVNGVTDATFFILPMLGKHPDEYPRFRNCFLYDEQHPEYDNHIHVYTRTGGGNREGYEAENEMMLLMPTFVTDYDDDFDSTFASWIFSVPSEWKDDFEKITSGDFVHVSAEYKEKMCQVYPKLKEKFNQLFAPPS